MKRKFVVSFVLHTYIDVITFKIELGNKIIKIEQNMQLFIRKCTYTHTHTGNNRVHFFKFATG